MAENKSRYTKEELEDLNGITSSRHGFIIPFSLDPLLDTMTVSEQGLTLSAIRHYVKSGETLNIAPKTFPSVAVKQFIEQYQKDAEKYLKVVNNNRVNGAKGGRPKQTDNS